MVPLIVMVNSPFLERVTKVSGLEDDLVVSCLAPVTWGALTASSPASHKFAAARSQPSVPLPAIKNGCVPSDSAKSTLRSIRSESPNTGMKAGETCEVPGVAFASKTGSENSIGPGMLLISCHPSLSSLSTNNVHQEFMGLLCELL